MRRTLALLVALGPLAGGVAFASPQRHVVLISVDTLRADHLSCYGDGRNLTPSIEGLARRGVLFEDTTTTIGKTGPSFASLFSSLYPPTHGARRNGVALRADVPVLAELLDAGGYRTAAFISNWTLRQNLAGLHRGFDHWDQEFDRKRFFFGARERGGRTLNRAVKDWFDRNPLPENERLFLWLHFSEPHTPYDLQREVDVPMPEDRSVGWQKRWRYATEVALVDRIVGEALDLLAERLELDRTLVIFVSDHGESLGEHAYWGHGKNTLWPNLDIPLIMAGPGLPAGKRIAGAVSIVDVLPTLVALLGLEPPERMEGRSLVDTWRTPLPDDRRRYAFGERHTALSKEGRETFEHPLEISLETRHIKTVYDFGARRARFYDLSVDPTEQRPLERSPVEADPPFYRQLADWYRDLPKFESSSGELSAEDIEQLRSLGYVEGR
jgi:arylsulfatase A-like enzyme